MNTLLWEETDWSLLEGSVDRKEHPYQYAAHLLENGVFNGTGKLCLTWDEVEEFAKLHKCVEIKKLEGDLFDQ